MPAISYRLDEFDVICAAGKDAEAFLQAQLSSDVLQLKGPSAQWTSLLSPQGRVQALMALYRRDTDAFALLVPHRQGSNVLAELRRFILRRKLGLELDQTLAAFGWPSSRAELPEAQLALSIDPQRCLGVAEATTEADTAPDGWFEADFEAGIPWLPEQAMGQHLPHALGLERLGAFSLKKGCYPGQEIVARTHYLGRNKRQLCLLQSEAPCPATPPVAAKLRDPDGAPAGDIVDVRLFGDRLLALAVMQRERTAQRFLVDESEPNTCAMKCVRDF